MTFGITSLSQLRLFLMACKFEGCDLSEITGLAPSLDSYKSQATHLRKLMLGSKLRGYDGLRLLQFGEITEGKLRQVLLTEKGKELKKIMLANEFDG